VLVQLFAINQRLIHNDLNKIFLVMKWLKIFLVCLSAILFIVVLYLNFSFFKFGYNQGRINFNYEVKTQQERDRTWRKIKLGDSLFSVSYWGGIRVDLKGNIYCWDYSYRLNKFSPEGKLIVRYGKGRGKGPGEFVMPVSFDVDSFGRVWVADASTGLIQIFNPDGKFYKSVRILSMPYRIKVLDRERFLIIKAMPADNLFEIYDINGKLLKSFGVISPEQSKFPTVFVGDIGVWGRSLYLIFHYLGYICCFDFEEGNVKYIAEMIDVIVPRFKVVEVNGKQAIKMAEDSKIASLYFSVHDGKIFIKSGKSLEVKETIIDVYSASYGVYLYSYRIPIRGFIEGGYFYQDRDTLIVKWEIR